MPTGSGRSRRSFVRQLGATAGAAAFAPAAMAEAGVQAPQLPEETPASVHPTLNRRARGWLRFLWEKATTPDDWGADGVPHPWWDRYSNPVVTSYGALRPPQLVLCAPAHGRPDAGLAGGLHADRGRARQPLSHLLGRHRLADADRRRPAAGQLSAARHAGDPRAAARPLQPDRLDGQRDRAVGARPRPHRRGGQPLLPRLVQPAARHLPLRLGGR